MVTLEFRQRLRISRDEAWDFFSSPRNLKEITPKHMGFEITSGNVDVKMYPGIIISYKIKPFPNIPVRWITEITHVKEKEYFVDEQRFGPYTFWHHRHIFNEIEEGVEMTDIVCYIVPFGPFGKILDKWLIRKQVRQIFSYRREILKQKFGEI